MNQRDSAVDHCSRHRQHAHGDDDEPIGDGGSFRSHAPQWRAALPAILQSGGGGGLSAQIGALQQSWRANPPADFARTELWEGAVAVRYAHLAATAINMRTGGGICAFVGLSECRGRALYPSSYPELEWIRQGYAFANTAGRCSVSPNISIRERYEK